MKLIDNWKEILTSAWSVRTSSFGAMLVGVGQGIKYIPASFLGLTPEALTGIGDILVILGGLLGGSTVFARLGDQGLAK